MKPAANTQEKPYRLGLVLSGGGMRGAAHIGLLKAFEELGIWVDAISGTSAGALVGAMYAGGFPPEEILALFKETPLFRWSNLTWTKPGLVNTDHLIKVLRRYFPKDDFADLLKPLYITATDLMKANEVCFHEGPLIKPILASAAFPVVFTPVQFEGRIYADGGILNNFPVEPLQGKCHKLIGSFVHVLEEMQASEMNSSLRMMHRAYDIVTIRDSMAKFDRCDLVINPLELKAYFLFDMRHVDEVYQIGYRAAMKEALNLQRLYDQACNRA
jgi:NTE family protein